MKHSVIDSKDSASRTQKQIKTRFIYVHKLHSALHQDNKFQQGWFKAITFMTMQNESVHFIFISEL
jgi:hypothetical protein